MSAFRFPLQRILELRVRREQAAAAELTRSRAAAEQARESRDELRATREANLATLRGTAGGAAKVGELRSSSYVVERLDERIQLAHVALNTADARVAHRVKEFSDLSRDRRLLELLRERQVTTWQLEQAHIDRIAMDGIALTRFTQKNNAEEGKK